MNRDKDLIAATDAHHRPVRVHAQRPGRGLQAKQTESLRAQNSAIQKLLASEDIKQKQNERYKSRIKTEITRLTVYTITPMH